MLNPSKQNEKLNSPVERANKINDTSFENSTGYYGYDLTHCEYGSTRFGEITPIMNIDTVPADRVVSTTNSKTILNQIDGNFLSTVNQYQDTFFVSLRNVFPVNYEKLIPNPTKGDDLPNAALPQVPILSILGNMLYSTEKSVEVIADDNFTPFEATNTLYNVLRVIEEADESEQHKMAYALSRLLLVSTVLSRGQLLDYLGFCLDTNTFNNDTKNEIQEKIDAFQRALWIASHYAGSNFQKTDDEDFILPSIKVTPNNDDIYDTSTISRLYVINTLSEYRQAIADIFERGEMPLFYWDSEVYSDGDEGAVAIDDLDVACRGLLGVFDSILYAWHEETTESNIQEYINDKNAQSNPFDIGYINIGKILAYQQIIAQYYTNTSIDNIFSSDLFMQNLRSIMFPTNSNGYTQEPVFEYNGVSTEYDYISFGATVHSLLSNKPSTTAKQWLWCTVMLLMRRSLRYGDYFANARPNMLAVTEQLQINVENGSVSPIDVTKNLLMQRYLNAVNYVGSGFLQYMSSIHGITPSDTGSCPRFISHRKIEMQNQITNNTADKQGAQTTNLVGFSDNQSMDVFIDDFGYILSLVSYDVLPVYKSGIDSTWHFSDRFDYFNPMLENIGDQPIRLSELIGYPEYRQSTFGYTMRNSEYKYKISRAHGAFVNSMPGFLISYPKETFIEGDNSDNIKINPDFIRDKASVLDTVVPQMTGVSPAEYYHFVSAFNNEVHAARKIQYTPPILF